MGLSFHLTVSFYILMAIVIFSIVKADRDTNDESRFESLHELKERLQTFLKSHCPGNEIISNTTQAGDTQDSFQCV